MKLTESSVIRFPLRQKSIHADFMTRVFLLIGLGIAVCSLAVWLLGGSGFDGITILFIIGFPAVGIWGWRRASIGEVELSEAGIRVRRRTQTETYPWEDISSVSSTKLERGDNAALCRMLGVDLSHPLVVVELKRSVRRHLLLNRFGTRSSGIRMGTRISIEPEDVYGFVEAANRYLKASLSENDLGQSLVP